MTRAIGLHDRLPHQCRGDRGRRVTPAAAACDDFGMPSRTLVLASASPARLRLLRDAGLDPLVEVSGFDEASVTCAEPRELVRRLAIEKARAVGARTGHRDALVLGCDSLLVLDGDALGKPESPQVARQRWMHMRGRSGVLMTGHALLDLPTARLADDVAETVVHFGTPDDEEIDAYVASGEPLAVAGAFTLDGRSAPFLRGIAGDPGNVIGLSLPLLRHLLRALDVRVTDLWR